MAITPQQIKQTYSGYAGWNDEAAIVADYNATGGAGKGGNPYALGNGAATMTPQPTPQPAPAPTNGFSSANVTTQAASSGSSEQALINAMTQKGHTPETAKAAIAGRGYADLAREYIGGSGAGVNMMAQPTINLPELYKSLYQGSGISSKEQELATTAQQLAAAKAKINDNPFLSEATRVGRIAKLDSLYNDSVGNLQSEIAMRKADIETQLNLQTKQFDIQSQQAQQSISQFNSLLASGALDNASGTDIANITASTGISSDMIKSAINNRRLSNLTTTTQTFDDGTNEGFIIYTLDQSGNIVNEVKKVTGQSAKQTTQYSTDPFVSSFISQFVNNDTTKTSTKPGGAAAAGVAAANAGLSISNLW
jgi:hypothetical protein